MTDRRSSDAQIKASNKYNATHTKIVPLRLNFTTDKDILEHLDRQSSIAGYIKDLIRADIAHEK